MTDLVEIVTRKFLLGGCITTLEMVLTSTTSKIICLGEFRSYFEKYGKVLTSEVMFNRETHKSRGFGFIVFESEKSVDDVCAEREHYIDGKMVDPHSFSLSHSSS